jgi:desulfoferrodoxin (superoxide reductase-like protein)
MISDNMTSNLTQCKFCMRKFNDSAAQKHIPVCERKSKENKMKQAPPKAVPVPTK